MSRYEPRCLTWQYFSLPGIRPAPGTRAFAGFRTSRSPLVSSILCFFYSTSMFKRTGCHLGTGSQKHGSEHESLLNHHFFLVGIDSTFRILRGDRDQVFPVGQERREIVERTIVAEIGSAHV